MCIRDSCPHHEKAEIGVLLGPVDDDTELSSSASEVVGLTSEEQVVFVLGKLHQVLLLLDATDLYLIRLEVVSGHSLVVLHVCYEHLPSVRFLWDAEVYDDVVDVFVWLCADSEDVDSSLQLSEFSRELMLEGVIAVHLEHAHVDLICAQRMRTC